MIFATFRIVIVLSFKFLSLIVFFFSKKRKPIALKNIDLCFPAKSFEGKKRNYLIARDSFLMLGHSIADFFLLRFYNKKNINHYVKFEGKYLLLYELQKGKGLIITGAHFGSCELAAHYLALHGFKSLVLYTPIKKPYWLEKFVKSNRQRSGNILISKYSSFLKLYRHLKKGGIVLALTDQHCSQSDGRKVPFFSHDVWTHTSFVKLSLKLGTPIVSGFVFIKNLFEYEIQFFKALYPQDFLKLDDPEYQMALASNRLLTKAILKKPNHWMWQHRRFKDL
ncbi:lysophospholipid acyltransferase family protein [Candidatus Dependentiae bacterium]